MGGAGGEGLGGSAGGGEGGGGEGGGGGGSVGDGGGGVQSSSTGKEMPNKRFRPSLPGCVEPIFTLNELRLS